MKPACVHIYSTMGLFEEAVDLALQVRMFIYSGNILTHPEISKCSLVAKHPDFITS